MERKIDVSSVSQDGSIGTGRRSQTFEGRLDSEKVCVKQFQLSWLSARSMEVMEPVFAAVDSLHSDHILKWHGWFEREGHASFVLEYASGGSVEAKVKAEGALREETAMTYALHGALAMKELYGMKPKVCYRHFNLGQMMIVADGRVKMDVCGTEVFFNAGGEFDEDDADNSDGVFTGTIQYFAPELIGGESAHNEKTDVYAFSVSLVYMLTGTLPFYDKNVAQYGMAVVGDQRPVIPSHISPATQALLQRCWRANPAERPRFEEIALVLESILVALSGDRSASEKLSGNKRPFSSALESGLAGESSRKLVRDMTTAELVVWLDGWKVEPFAKQVSLLGLSGRDFVGLTQEDIDDLPVTLRIVQRKTVLMLLQFAKDDVEMNPDIFASSVTKSS